MKPNTFRALIISVGSTGLISYVIAGSGSAGEPGAQLAPVDNAVVTPTKVPTDFGPGFNARVSAAGQSTAANASANGSVDASSTGPSNGSSAGGNASSNSAANGLLDRNENAGSISIGRGEKMVETPATELAAAEAAEKSEKSEVAKKFESSILNQGINEIANSKASSKVPDFAPINPVTGETIPPRPSLSQPPISSIASATGSRDLSPLPSATVIPRPKD